MRVGDLIKNKMKEGPLILLTKVDGAIYTGIIMEGQEDGERVTLSKEDMWVFEKVGKV